jgi:cyanate permease
VLPAVLFGCYVILQAYILAGTRKSGKPRVTAFSQCFCALMTPHVVAACLQAYVLANTSVSGKSTRSIPWGKLLSRKEVWAIIVCHFCHNWGTFILLTWMPTYYNQVGAFK